jgi:hypothetical protein
MATRATDAHRYGFNHRIELTHGHRLGIRDGEVDVAHAQSLCGHASPVKRDDHVDIVWIPLCQPLGIGEFAGPKAFLDARHWAISALCPEAHTAH